MAQRHLFTMKYGIIRVSPLHSTYTNIIKMRYLLYTRYFARYMLFARRFRTLVIEDLQIYVDEFVTTSIYIQ